MGRKEWGVSSGEWRMRCLATALRPELDASGLIAHLPHMELAAWRAWGGIPGADGAASRVQMGRHPGCRWGGIPGADWTLGGTARTHRATARVHPEPPTGHVGVHSTLDARGCSLGASRAAAWARGHAWAGTRVGTSWARAGHELGTRGRAPPLRRRRRAMRRGAVRGRSSVRAAISADRDRRRWQRPRRRMTRLGAVGSPRREQCPAAPAHAE